MLKIKFFIILITTGFINARCLAQTDITTQTFVEDLRRLVALNSFHGGGGDFSGPEAISLSNASVAQLIEITTPYFNSGIKNAKTVCVSLLFGALFKKVKSEEERQEIVEIICRNYLTTDEEVQIIDGVLLLMNEKDFTPTAKKYIAALIDSIPKFCYGCCAQLMAVAQIKENIPALWKIAKKDITKMDGADIDVLASLARMGEKEAGQLLCNYYTSDWNKRERKGVVIKYYVSFAKHLAFSLDRSVLDCLVSDFRNFDMNIKENGGDYFWWPGQYLGMQITDMLKNYPYPKDYKLDPQQLLDWLNTTDRYEIVDK